jgi:5-methyltetrahydrofolate--homocysteine methyltransferase
MSETAMNATYTQLAESIEIGEEDDARQLAQQALAEGHDPADIIKSAMALGVRRAGDRFNAGEFFLPELMLTGEAMKAGLAVVMPVILEAMQGGDTGSKGKVMMGTVEGDVHDIGKNICLAMLQAQSYDVIDLGVDNDQDWIVEQVKKEKPDILGLGSYMTTTMIHIPPTFERLRQEGLTEHMKLLTGGVAINRRWAMEVARADGYADDAWGMIDLVNEIMGHGPPRGYLTPAEEAALREEREGIGYGRGEKVKIR